MDSKYLVGLLIYNFFTSLPTLAVYIIGLVFAIINWSRYPKAAAFAAAGIAILLVTLLFNGAFDMFASHLLYESGGNGRILAAFLAFLRAVVEAVGLGLIIGGVFAGRNGVTPATGMPGKG